MAEREVRRHSSCAGKGCITVSYSKSSEAEWKESDLGEVKEM